MANGRFFRITKPTIIVFILSLPLFSFSQQKVITKTGVAKFEASMPSFEEVKAINKNTVCAINTSTGDIACVILIKNFKFKVNLMEEHFNENYLESEKFPKATFKGKIQNFTFSQLTNQKQEYKIKGIFEIHGKNKELEVSALISKNKEVVLLHSDFILNTDDFDIDLPILIRSKVAKKVKVDINLELQ